MGNSETRQAAVGEYSDEDSSYRPSATVAPELEGINLQLSSISLAGDTRHTANQRP